MILSFLKPAVFVVLGFGCLIANSQGNVFAQEMKTIDQHLKFKITYKLDFILDSTNLNRKTTSFNLLSIGETSSLFECLNMKRSIEHINQISSLPTDVANALAANFAMENRSTFRTMVLKKKPTKTMTTYDMVFADSYKYDEEMGLFDWHITGKEKSIMGYKVLEATTSYGCRDWVAWFTPDIPISDGPYKFHGLPGLIFKIADSQGHYVFEIVAIEIPSNKETIEFPVVNWKETTRTNFIRVRNNFFENANPHLGNYTSDAQSRARIASRFRSFNNFIDLCAD